MTATEADTVAELQRTNIALQERLDAALAQRASEFSERIDHQAATIDVLKAMSSTPDDIQPVFDLIVRRATELCNGVAAALYQFDGSLVHFRAVYHGVPDPGRFTAVAAMFPMAPTREVIACRAILDRQIVHIRDTQAEPGLSEAVRQRLRDSHRSQVSIPLMRDSQAIGAISLGGEEPGGFTDSQIALLETFAEQAVIAITSAETYRGLHESLEQQTATAEVLKVINTSPGNLMPVFNAMLEKAMRLCGAAFGMLRSFDGEQMRTVATRGVPPAFAEYSARTALTPMLASGPARALETGRPAQMMDITEGVAYQSGEPGARALADLGGARTVLHIPLFRDQASVGLFSFYRQEVRAFTGEQIALLENFAAQAVIAIENTRLLTEQREALEQQTATAELLQVINASPGNLVPVFDAILQKAHDLCDIAYGDLQLYDGEHLHSVAQRGLSAEFADRLRQGYRASDSPATRPLLAGDRFTHIIDAAAVDSMVFRSTVRLDGIRTVLFVPLRKDGSLLGMITSARRELRPFTEKEIALLENFAAQAVIAMENARLLTEQQEALERQTATAEVLEVINASPGNLTPVFDAMLEKAMRLCGAAFGSLYTYDGEHFHSAAQRGVPPAYAAFRAENPPLLTPGGGPATLLETRRPVHVLDLMKEESYRTGNLGIRAMVELGGIRTILSVPLLREDVFLGMIAIFRQEVRAYSEKEIALLQNFAAQAVIAMENARLIAEQREALERQTATAEVLQVINGSPGNLAPVFDAILEKAVRLCQSAIGALFTYDGQFIHFAAAYGMPLETTSLFLEPRLPAKGAPTGRIAGGEPFVHVLDATDQDIYRAGDRPTVAFVDQIGARTALFVGLRQDATLLGYLVIFRLEVHAFSDKEIALVMNFAAQAVIAMENARLIDEQREALEQQTATAEVLEVINASPGNLAPVFEALLEKAMRLCGAAFGSLYTYDGERFDSAAQRGVPPAYAAYRARNPPPASGGGPAAIFETRRPLHVLDLMEEEPYRARNPGVRAMVELGGIRTILTVPLIKDDAFLGVITIYRQEVRAFTDKQISLLENFAAQAVIAMENARLLTEQREALEQQTATAEVLQVINASPADLTPVFATMLERAMRLCDAAFGSLLIYDGEHLRAAALRSVPEEFASFLRKPIVPEPGTAMAQVIDERRIVHWNDARAQEAYLNGAPLAMAGVEGGGVRTLIGVPLVKDGNLLGIVHLYRQEVRPFSDKHIALLQNFAAQAVIAMENARLITEQREALEQQTATNEVLRVINSSPGNLAPVFDTILERARVLCGFAHGTLNLFDGTHFYTVATYDIPEAFAEVLRRPRISGPQAPLLRGDRIIHIPDFQTVEATSDDPVSRAAIEAGIRTVLFVALRNERGLLGYLTADRMEVRPFSEKEIGVMESFAAQAVIAMENARLLNEVRQRQEELRITFENMGDGVAMFDETQHLVAWNSKFQQIYDLPDVLLEQQRTYEEHLHYLAARGDFGAGVDTVEQIHELVASTGQPYGYERTRPDGRVIEIRRNPVPDGGFVLIFSDITERKRSEAEIRSARDAAEEAYRNLKAAQANLIQAEKMASLGQLTAGIAHEIKNPLNFVNNFAALSVDLLSELKETAAPGFAALTEKQRAEIDEVSAMLTGNLEKIIEHGKRADGIVKAMLEHSRGSSGERRVVDLNVVIDEALNLAYHGARAQDQSFNIALERDFSEGIAPIEVNPQDMTRVFLNIFSNGFYAANKRAQNGAASGFVPTLKVSTRGSGDAVEIRVRDNGTGIPADIRDKLFQPFFTTKPTGEGTGLGLSITYDIVTQQHGGSIAVDSKVGEYSEFTIRLPRKP